METAAEDQRGGVSKELTSQEAELPEQQENSDSAHKHNNLTASNGTMEEEEEEEEGVNKENGSEGTEGADGGEDLSSIKAMITTVMIANQLNGAVDSASASSTPSKSTPTRAPSISRNARKNQDAKDDSLAFICPLCDKNCMTQHALTMHIRQHNSENGATDHSCSICGKALSSASSLDRHMLVHSGERPYKCSVCGQTFTTNGNMHRHMKIHDKDPASSSPISPPSPTKRRRPSAKRKAGMEDELERDEPPNKKVLEDSVLEELTRGEVEPLPCPICFKTFNCKYDLENHMDTHPDTTLRCDLCCISFRTHRGLLRHNAAIHKLLPSDPSGRPFIQNNPSIPTGFNDLAFIDFSCRKFPHIAQVWCETNLRRCTSKFHRFVCESCDKAFPLRSALELHKTTNHQQGAPSTTPVPAPATPAPATPAPATPAPAIPAPAKPASAKPAPATPAPATGGAVETPEEDGPPVEGPAPQQANFMSSLGLQHVSQVKPLPSEEAERQAQLDSIKVIHVEPPLSTLPQEAAAAYLGGLAGLASLGGLGGLGVPLLEAVASSCSLQGLSQREALSLLSLQPFQTGFLLQPDGGAVVKPVSGEGGVMELADIQQILKVAAAAPNQMGLLPPLAKAPGYSGGPPPGQGQKAMPPLKPKPLVTPRSSLAASTPPPLQSTQLASLGRISPGLPPPTPCQTSSSSSSSSSSSMGGQMEAECMGDAHMPSDSTEMQFKLEEAGPGGLGGAGKKGGGGRGGGGAKAMYPCRFCDQVFAYSGVLQAHMRYHLGILPHQCNICDYVAPDKATLIRHLRTHSGERPYVCRVCHYPFTVKANCERHLRKKHAKNSRKEIEKNIKYVTATTGPGGTVTTTTTQDTLELASSGETSCRFCGEDLKTYRALQIHLRTHNGCQRKPFECRRCGAAFLAKRNCIHHLLKQHPEVQEREIEEHIATLLPATGAAPVNGLPPAPSSTLHPSLQAVKVEDLSVYQVAGVLDQPLDFSNKRGGGGGGGSGGSSLASSQAGSPGIKLEALSPGFDGPLDQPIDLSIPKHPSKKLRREGPSVAERREIKLEQSSPSILDHQQQALQGGEERTAPQTGCYQHPTTTLIASGRALRLKPLLPKPAATSSSSSYKELPPLASIAQIISSVSGPPALLKREASLDAKLPAGLTPVLGTEPAELPGGGAGLEGPDQASAQGDDTTQPPEVVVVAKKRGRKKGSQAGRLAASLLAKMEPGINTGSGIDLESSGEFASVEKMLATTDANKFSPYLQTGAGELGGRTERGGGGGGGEEKEGPEESKRSPGPTKAKKNAYSNSVQKMTCPFCPRVFPWASSLQRHMLTHTGQKPYPCPKCDAFFSTKSNCERHLLRKHGVTNRSLRRNGGLGKGKDGDDGSHESAESQSDGEMAPMEAVDLSSSEQDQRPGSSDPHRAQHDSHQGAAERRGAPGHNQHTEDDEDSQSNKSLDLNFARKLIDFKFSSGGGEGGGQHSQPSSSSSSSSSSVVGEEPERAGQSQESELKLSCKVCKKSFRYAATLARHERAHLGEGSEVNHGFVTSAATMPFAEEEELDEEDEEMEVDGERAERGSEGGDSDSEGEEKEKEERSDEEGGASEPKNGEGEAGGGASKADKRKKICNVCSKRFWSLQDLTRHMRSHTGERPYQCQVCERTFTLKHSLVRHQRIHLKPRGAEGLDASEASGLGGADDEGYSGRSGSEGEFTPTSTCPPSENESEGLRDEAGEGENSPQKERPQTQAQVQVIPEPPAEPASENTAEPPAEPELQQNSEPSSEPVVEPAEEPAVEQTSEGVSVEEATEPATDTDAATDTAADVTPEKENDPATDMAAASEPEPATDTPADPSPLASATDETAESSKDPPASPTSPPADPEKAPSAPTTSPPPSEGFIQGRLEIRATPSLEHLLPSGEPPLVGVE